MPNFLCLQRSLPGGDAEKPSPSDMQEMYARFGAWQQKFKDNLVDMGGKLGAGKLAAAGRRNNGNDHPAHAARCADDANF